MGLDVSVRLRWTVAGRMGDVLTSADVEGRAAFAELAVGDKILHRVKFLGRVLELIGGNKKSIITILFKVSGVKPSGAFGNTQPHTSCKEKTLPPPAS